MTEEEPALLPLSLRFDYPRFWLNGNVFVPQIYDGGIGEKVPAGFNAVRIPLDGRATSDLDWRQAREAAQRAVQDQGLYVLWDMDLGLFSRITSSFSDIAQFHALRLSLQHFAETLWMHFAKHTLGIVVYRGLADWSTFFPWNAERQQAYEHWLHEVNAPASIDHRALARLFCRDACADYLYRLTAGLPGDLLPWLLLDTAAVKDPATVLELTHRDCWSRFTMGLKNPTQLLFGFGWDYPSPYGYLARSLQELPSDQLVSAGLLLPSRDEVSEASAQGIRKALEHLQTSGMPFRVLTEELLTAEWDQLQTLVVIADCVGPMCKRKLQGFEAAGGMVISL